MLEIGIQNASWNYNSISWESHSHQIPFVTWVLLGCHKYCIAPNLRLSVRTASCQWWQRHHTKIEHEVQDLGIAWLLFLSRLQPDERKMWDRNIIAKSNITLEVIFYQRISLVLIHTWSGWTIPSINRFPKFFSTVETMYKLKIFSKIGLSPESQVAKVCANL